MIAAAATAAERKADVVAKALVKAAQLLEISQKELHRILGPSESTISRLFKGQARIMPSEKSFELAALFLRVFRSLDALMGGREDKARAWLTHENAHLGGIPLHQLRRAEGLVRVAEYLDAMRGHA